MADATWTSRDTALVAGAAAVGCGIGAALAWAVASRRPNEGEEAAAASKTSAASGSERRVAVFCGSSLPSGPRGEAIKKAAVALGEAIPAEGMEMVFGGGNIGLMGTIARAVDRAGGRITGVIPRTLAAREVSGKPVQQENEIITETMHERKMLMASMSAGFIAMPGGFGTLEELFEAVTWTQLNIHSKPVGLLNVGGFYDPLVAQVDVAVEEGLIQPTMRDIIVVDSDPVALLRKLRSHRLMAGTQLALDWSSKGAAAGAAKA
ncbi:hypothetical protein FNF27_04467 [Cafeteria roenbergensis]|uniref:Cytokinin riboside 5'-monophosphate phosphoribohydrolase n=1 Tax=Cafeteria roenbergensis TaxID=33653 RepID=A0A5A8CQ18_CAFRO|nr:hypothetical protein FNF28_07487 [Cafeteria roenbergensis]KAA0150879.1 hypothetical protein FNF29_04993 [Cafeteria roenbergensis]KAA0154809.1 hypothetical protein FNF31_06228 [Cafeteria roenbergensis]KAA0174081.1 hypothetical protein FNF27_04467 [Cafeteria roenbergensis]|eukprot:KAA0150879.1 hypothetical protein FNF29_04993 [Cafeteria roenbergensis]